MNFSSWKNPLSIAAIIFVSSVSALLQPAQAATSLPSDLQFECGAYSLTQQRATCYLQVPGEVMGVDFEISIPKDPLSQIQNLDKDEQLPSTSVFLENNLQNRPSEVGISIGYFGLDASNLGSSAYYLIKADFKLSGVDQGDFPIVIPAILQQGSELYTIDSLNGDEEHFNASIDLQLPIRISLQDETSRPTPTYDLPPIKSSFTIKSSFRVDVDDQGGELRGSAETCFDDDSSSLSAEEWAIICKAKAMGIVSGNPRDDGIFFFPHQPINRAEAVKILTLGILRTFNFLTDNEFAAKQQELISAARPGRQILYPDVRFDDDGAAPWFAQYLSIASEQEIATGYPEDGTFRPGNKINNAESYRVIVETGRVASSDIANTLRRVSTRTKAMEWFMKYAWTLNEYDLDYSEEYGDFTKRKDFLLLVMKLLQSAGAIQL